MTQRPPNPYVLGPIKRRDRLAGRSHELKELEYYLGLARAGQSPHVALIGQRGVGKTSLLRAVAELAASHSLLPVSIDLNESKVRSAGVFWHDLYSTLILEAAELDCWGGVTGRIYSSLVEQLFQKTAINLEFAVLQFPLAIARHDGDLAGLQCPDALIVHDFRKVRQELQRHGLQGVALLLDEGDCLGAQRGLLQMLRNVLQRVDGTCFVITGSESLFDIVADVFSPIPRQFHRLNVTRFSEWTETLELLQGPTPKEVWPSMPTVVELHEVCQGDPAELQLYCHHMYKAIEGGSVNRMELTPEVYRSVRGAYRAHSQAVELKVLNAIDELPDELLVKSRWLRRRRLSLEENVELERLLRELRNGHALSADSIRQLHEAIAAGYKELHERGISSTATSLSLIGGTVTAGYWKSLVQTKKTKRWAWVDGDLAALARDVIAGALAEIGQGTVRGRVGENEIGATEALGNLRAGREFKNVARGDLSRWMLACVASREKKTLTLIDVTYRLEWRRTTPIVVSYVGSDATELRQLGEAWMAMRREILRGHGIALAIERFTEVEAPTNREMWRLGRTAAVLPPSDVFGPGLMSQALDLFVEGRLEEALGAFEAMLGDRDEPLLRNNVAYCLTAMGRAAEALAHIRKGAELETPLRQHNLGVAEALNGNWDAAKRALRQAWKMQEEAPEEEDVLCMLILSRDQRSARSTEGIPLTAALLTNMLTTGAEEEAWCKERLSSTYGEEYRGWVEGRR